ncbi:(2Fe-2S)-binding protein [Alcaligenaceae bacterium]|nr:(2Fe-2S)-binding protein [Alcaligenaceae bacterium]
MYICICNAITERQVQAAVAEGASSLADLQAQLGVATCCGCCADTATEYLPGGRYVDQATTVQAAIPDFHRLVEKVALCA